MEINKREKIILLKVLMQNLGTCSQETMTNILRDINDRAYIQGDFISIKENLTRALEIIEDVREAK